MDAVEIIEEALHDLEHSKITCKEFDEIVKPFRDCVPVKKGKWIPRIGLKHPDWFTCSECTGQFDYKWNYCPYCGADMRKSE
jgi:hypothetical protein